MPAIQILTRDAAASENLTAADYREIYDELRSKTTLREFAHVIGSGRSFAWWSKYERGEAHLARQDRNDLRRAVGLPALPLSVEEAVAGISPDAVVYRIGDQLADRIVIIADPQPITVHVNSGVTVLDPAPESAVTPVTAPTPPAARPARPRSSITLDRPVWARLNAIRTARSLTWEQLLTALLEDA
jgi:hypothetical protein